MDTTSKYELLCPSCLRSFLDRSDEKPIPMLGKCGHSVCSCCVWEMLSMACPVCRLEDAFTNAKKNFIFDDIASQIVKMEQERDEEAEEAIREAIEEDLAHAAEQQKRVSRLRERMEQKMEEIRVRRETAELDEMFEQEQHIHYQQQFEGMARVGGQAHTPYYWNGRQWVLLAYPQPQYRYSSPPMDQQAPSLPTTPEVEATPQMPQRYVLPHHQLQHLQAQFEPRRVRAQPSPVYYRVPSPPTLVGQQAVYPVEVLNAQGELQFVYYQYVDMPPGQQQREQYSS